MRTRIKICCIGSPTEAQLAVTAGADALGLVAAMPSGPGPISDEAIAEIVSQVPPPVDAWLLTSRAEASAIVDHITVTGVRTVQIVRHVAAGTHEAIRRALPNVRIVQVVHVEDESAVDLARAYSATADALLLDSGRPSAQILGGVGAAHDWAISRRIVAVVSRPVFLAGGLNPANVAEAVATVRPFGVDLCNGVRTGGALDAGKLAAFVKALA
jgi:phosphoribosylanthranilate isomerase